PQGDRARGPQKELFAEPEAMTRYECRFASGRQFIFEERPRWVLLGLLAVVFFGMIIGLGIGLAISFAGIYSFELLMLSLALLMIYETHHLTFKKVSAADDLAGFILGVVIFSLALVACMVIIRYLISMDLDSLNRYMLLTLLPVALALLGYLYAGLCCQE
ncbi:unnamed protein product, partial [Polarella glacialis]